MLRRLASFVISIFYEGCLYREWRSPSLQYLGVEIGVGVRVGFRVMVWVRVGLVLGTSKFVL